MATTAFFHHSSYLSSDPQAFGNIFFDNIATVKYGTNTKNRLIRESYFFMFRRLQNKIKNALL